MNNPLNLRVLVLPGVLPVTSRIKHDELEERKALKATTESALSAIEEKAATIRAESENLLKQAEEEASLLMDKARENAENLKSSIQEEAVENAIQWLCDERMMEQLIAQELENRWRHLTARCLKELLGEQNQNALLLQRMEIQVRELLLEGRIILSLPPAAFHQAVKIWDVYKEIELKIDPELKDGQACIDNGLIRIHLDLPAQQSKLLEQLAAPVYKETSCLTHS